MWHHPDIATKSSISPKLSDFDYPLPEALIAQYPPKKRDESRLMVLNRSTGSINHSRVSDLPSYITENDLLILNDTRVRPARILARKKTGGSVELLLLEEVCSGLWEALIKQKGRVREGMKLYLDGKMTCEVEKKKGDGKYLIRFSVKEVFDKWLKIYGQAPLPPYIKREEASDIDRDRYQTVYARKEGAIAAPTAGLHFTKSLLDTIRCRGAGTAFITLHVGTGTFRPVRSENIRDHVMDEEHFEIIPSECKKIDRALEEKKRIIAVGTTSVRTIETAIATNMHINKKSGKSGLFMYPGFKFKAVGAILTNFHLPRSTPFMLVSAFAGLETIKKCYREAVKEEYRFYSYGDAMLIL